MEFRVWWSVFAVPSPSTTQEHSIANMTTSPARQTA